ncbi:Uncharacterized protein HZ326_9252 [Fusarium oxysporum f. sp. albedinis]|nr:Uncharacterized protein HZ326_9252 [Fusarium oxysporum f. sp. albedinis]
MIILGYTEQIRSSLRSRSDLVVRANEFSLAFHQLFEFRILDVHCEVLINTTLQHPGKLCHTTKTYKVSSLRRSYQGFGGYDLEILHGFLATGGYQDMLPSNDDCIPAIPVYQVKHRETL